MKTPKMKNRSVVLEAFHLYLDDDVVKKEKEKKKKEKKNIHVL